MDSLVQQIQTAIETGDRSKLNLNGLLHQAIRFEADKKLLERLYGVHKLTSREREVLIFCGKGMTNKEMGEATGAAAQTLAYHVKKVFRKLEVVSKEEAAVIAVKVGLV